MNASSHLRAAVDARLRSVAAAIPSDRANAILALVRAIDALPTDDWPTGSVDPVTGIPVPALGASRALHLALNAPPPLDDSPRDLDGWATSFLDHCRDIARAEIVLGHAETGFMRLDVRRDGEIEARIAQRLAPGRWRERADDAWWRGWLTRQHGTPAAALLYRYDLSPDTVIDGIRMERAATVVAELNGTLERSGVTSMPRAELISRMARRLGLAPGDIGRVCEALTLSPVNAEWHAAVPGIADPPLILLPDDRIALSRRGLTVDPFRFLTRELRRRAPDAYHAAAAGREALFRLDLSSLFRHRRFVTSPGRIELRGETRTARTDIDAAVFDRKTGALALFELKSHEPYARTTAELLRTQESVRAAGRQVGAILDWVNRYGGQEILNRIDRTTAKGFRVQKVIPFVLGRHLIDGAPLDRRAVWATLPQMLRALDGRAIEELSSNPIASLAARLPQVEPLVSPLDVREAVTVHLGDVTVRVEPKRPSSG